MTDFGKAVFCISVLEMMALPTLCRWEAKKYPEHYDISKHPEAIIFLMSELVGMLLLDLYMVCMQWERGNRTGSVGFILLTIIFSTVAYNFFKLCIRWNNEKQYSVCNKYTKKKEGK